MAENAWSGYPSPLSFMDERGQHQITSAGASAGLWAYLVVGLVLLAFLVLILSTAWNSMPRTAEIQSLPHLPRTADLESVDGASDLKLVLGEGSYEFIYQTATVSTDVPPNGSPGVFFADFSTGEHSGDAAGAGTYILSGKIKLTISDIKEQDTFLAQLAQAGHRMNAFFSFSQSARRPPPDPGKPFKTSTRKIKVIILGKIEEVTFPAGRGNSRQRIDILDLGPSYEDFDLPPVPAARDPLRSAGPRDEPESSPVGRPSPDRYRAPKPHSVH
jgi:hypothetical protein